MKKIPAAILFSLAITGLAAARTGTWHGWVSDSKCGAAGHDAACVKKCEDAGEKLVFVSSDKKVIPVTNPETLKGHEGHHVTVKGDLENGMLTVRSVQMMKDQGMMK